MKCFSLVGAARALFVIAALLVSACSGGGSSPATVSPDTPSAAPGPKAYAVSFRGKYVTGNDSTSVDPFLMTTSFEGAQLLLLDLENPETPPVVIDQNVFPFPQGPQSFRNTAAADYPILIPQEDASDAATGLGQKFDRYLVYLKRGNLFIVDLLKTGKLPVPRQLSSASIAAQPLYMARLDKAQLSNSFIAYKVTVNGLDAWGYVRLDMSATDEPLNVLPFEAARAQFGQDRSTYFPILSRQGGVQGGFRMSPLQANSDGKTFRKLLQHVDTTGKVLREFASTTVGFPFPDPPSTPLTMDIHPSLLWCGLDLCVLALAPGEPGVPAPGGYAIYRLSTLQLTTGVLPARPLGQPDASGGFTVLAQDENAIYFNEMASDGAITLHKVDTQTFVRTPVRPDLKNPRGLFNRWPYLVVEDSLGQVTSINLSTPEYASQPLSSRLNWNYPGLLGLDNATVVMRDATSIQIRSLGREEVTQFANQQFLGWASTYTATALQQPFVNGQLVYSQFSNPYMYQGVWGGSASTGGEAGLGWSRSDGELEFLGPERSILPTHFLMVAGSGAGASVSGVVLSSRGVIDVGQLPRDLTPMGGVYMAMAPTPTYAGRWVFFHALGEKTPCVTIPPWMKGTACDVQYSDILVADPAKAGSLRRLTNQANSRF